MRTVLTIALLFALGVVSAQEKKTVKDSVAYEFLPRYYNISPCGCPSDGLAKPTQERDRDYSPYKWESEGPITIDPSDTTLIKWLILKKTVRKETDPSVL